MHRKLNKYPFVLCAQYFDLRNVRDLEEPRPNVFDVVAKLAMRKPFRCEPEDDSKRVAEIIVEARSDNPDRQGMTNVADAFADVIPDIGNLTCRRVTLQIHEDRCGSRTCKAAQEVELRRLLKRALETLSNLLQRFFNGCSRPSSLHDHGLDDEGRVFGTTKAEIRKDAGD